MEISDNNKHQTSVVLNGTTQSMKISATADFFHNLSDTLYTDKPLAVAREVMCNGWDAHTANNEPNKPIIITREGTQFSFKDFGLGIPHEDFLDIYGTYGLSTKVQDENQTGGFGLGCKSPFALVDVFTVTSINDEIKTIYAINKNSVEEGKPGITLLTSLPSEEPSGITVTFDLNDNITANLLDEAIELVAKNSKQKCDYIVDGIYSINSKNSKQIKLNYYDELQILPDSEDNHILKVRYGNVIYPVEVHLPSVDNIEEYIDTDPLAYSLSKLIYLIHELSNRNVSINRGTCHSMFLNFFLDASPNSISVVPSREALSMSKKTIKHLVSVTDKTYQKLLKNSQKIKENRKKFLIKSLQVNINKIKTDPYFNITSSNNNSYDTFHAFDKQVTNRSYVNSGINPKLINNIIFNRPTISDLGYNNIDFYYDYLYYNPISIPKLLFNEYSSTTNLFNRNMIFDKYSSQDFFDLIQNEVLNDKDKELYSSYRTTNNKCSWFIKNNIAPLIKVNSDLFNEARVHFNGNLFRPFYNNGRVSNYLKEKLENLDKDSNPNFILGMKSIVLISNGYSKVEKSLMSNFNWDRSNNLFATIYSKPSTHNRSNRNIIPNGAIVINVTAAKANNINSYLNEFKKLGYKIVDYRSKDCKRTPTKAERAKKQRVKRTNNTINISKPKNSDKHWYVSLDTHSCLRDTLRNWYQGSVDPRKYLEEHDELPNYVFLLRTSNYKEDINNILYRRTTKTKHIAYIETKAIRDLIGQPLGGAIVTTKADFDKLVALGVKSFDDWIQDYVSDYEKHIEDPINLKIIGEDLIYNNILCFSKRLIDNSLVDKIFKHVYGKSTHIFHNETLKHDLFYGFIKTKDKNNLFYNSRYSIDYKKLSKDIIKFFSDTFDIDLDQTKFNLVTKLIDDLISLEENSKNIIELIVSNSDSEVSLQNNVDKFNNLLEDLI